MRSSFTASLVVLCELGSETRDALNEVSTRLWVDGLKHARIRLSERSRYVA
jgi:hypothetical protein